MAPPISYFKDADGFRLEFDPVILEEERKFYSKVYPSVDLVCERKVHCTVCDTHIGTAPAQENIIRMHPVLRVTHCKKCHDFYNSGEFSKGEDGSELYCRWCGQGGEVYCCSKCPYVFCKNCIVQNLSRGCVNDIEENENWNCFVCAPKIMWHLRAQHWALMNFIEKQKNSILSDADLTDADIRRLMTRDKTICCKKRAKSGTISDSSCDSDISFSKKRKENKFRKLLPKSDRQKTESPEPKRAKLNNAEVVCTPDVLSMLERDNASEQPPVAPVPPIVQPVKVPTPPVKPTSASISPKVTATSPQILTIPVAPQQKLGQQKQAPPVQAAQIIPGVVQQDCQMQSPGVQHNVQPPPLIIRNFSPQLRTGSPTVVTRKTIVGARAPVPTPGTTPVYHTINGFRIDLNSAAQQETFRLPNGKLIQVKKQGTGTTATTATTAPTVTTQPGNMIASNTVNNGMNSMNPLSAVSTVTVNGQVMRTQLTPRGIASAAHSMIQQQSQAAHNFQVQSPQLATIRYAPGCGQMIPGTTTITATIPNGPPGTAVHLLNGTPLQQVQQLTSRPTPIPTLVRQFFSATPLGQARSQLQNQVFSGMEICQHLTGKIHTLTNSNAYKSVRNYTDVKELYIHLSYLFTYAIGRFKSLQDKCLEDMRRLGFAGDAASLESGHLEKHAEDGDEDEVEIVEPKTTCIDLDSDNEDSTPSIPNSVSTAASRNSLVNKSLQTLPQIVNIQHVPVQQSQQPPPLPPPPLVVPAIPQPHVELAPPTTPTHQMIQISSTPTTPSTPGSDMARLSDCDLDVTANLLAGMLEVELTEGNSFFNAPVPETTPKKPRKKTTNKPNPHLIKQQQLQERERIKEMIRRDAKLNSKCHVVVNRIECVVPEVKKMLEERKKGQIKTRTISLSLEAGEFSLKDLSGKKAPEVTKEVKADTKSTDNKSKASDVSKDVPIIIQVRSGEETIAALSKSFLEGKTSEVISKEDKSNDEHQDNNEDKGDKSKKEESNEPELKKDAEEKKVEAENETPVAKENTEVQKIIEIGVQEENREETQDTVELMDVDKDFTGETAEEKEKDGGKEDQEKDKEKKNALLSNEDKSPQSLESDENMKDVSSTSTERKETNCDGEEVKQVGGLKSTEKENTNKTESKEEYLTVIEVVETPESQEPPSSQNSQKSTAKDTNDEGKEVQLHQEITAILNNGIEDSSQDSMRHSPITSGDSMDYLAAMDE